MTIVGISRMLFKYSVLAVIAAAFFPATAQSEDRYEFCRDKARDISGYYGAVPAEYEQRGGALQGAIKGAASGAALGWISGGDTKKAAKRGAALGAFIGAIKKAEQDKKRRENELRRRNYEIELHACMRG